MTSTDLKNWQARMGFTQAQAAAALGISLSAYKDLLKGTSRNTGAPVSIDRRTELSCAALAAGITHLDLA